MLKKLAPFWLIALFIWSDLIFAASAKIIHEDPISPVILGVTSVTFFAIVGRFIAAKLKQPPVLGALIMGILVGNIFYYYGNDMIFILREGPAVFDAMNMILTGHSLHTATVTALGGSAATRLAQLLRTPSGPILMQVAHVMDVFSRYGIIFLLFFVGLENTIEELRKTCWSSLRVAVIGVVAPFVMGYFAVKYLLPQDSTNTHLFLAATLCATSIGISARVFSDLGRSKSPAARVILGAAVIDDVLCLIILAIVSGMVISGKINVRTIVEIVILASCFIIGVFMTGSYIIKGIVKLLRRLGIYDGKLFVSLFFVMFLAWFASLVHLAPLIGAFAAGLILNDKYFSYPGCRKEHNHHIHNLVKPLEMTFVPLFFILIGIQVKLELFINWDVILIASVLILVAIISKMLSGIGAKYKKLLVGTGMIPRGEVCLVFAAIGKNLEVLSDKLFAAVVLMTIITAIATPITIKQIIKHPEYEKPLET